MTTRIDASTKPVSNQEESLALDHETVKDLEPATAADPRGLGTVVRITDYCQQSNVTSPGSVR